VGRRWDTYDNDTVNAISISHKAFQRLALALAALYALLVVTGGAVRLSGSGLGCPDWPSCYQNKLTAAVSFHPLIEFGNRLVTVGVSVVSIVVFLAALSLQPKRKEIRGLAFGIILGLVAQIVLGGLVVLFKLNPYLVAVHFLLTLVVLAIAILLYCFARRDPGPLHKTVSKEVLWFTRLQLGVLSILLVAGTFVTGSGPHAGGPGAKRIPVAFRDMAELHSTIALFLIGLSLGGLFVLHLGEAPYGIQRQARTVLEIYAVQGLLGYLQYALHDAPVVVEFHLIFATSAFGATLILYLACFDLGHAATAPPQADQYSEPLPV
jgi:cytochrome c oxidase assembly protein subunit 15